MEQPKVLFVEWCAKDALEGTQMLEPLEELAYRRIIDFIYSTNDMLPDDDKRLQRLTKTGRKWKSIKETLIAFNKIESKDGFIRCKKCTSKLEKSRKNIAQKSASGKASAEKRKALKNKETNSTAVATDDKAHEGAAVPAAAPTNQEPLIKKKINKKRKGTEKAKQHKPPIPDPPCVNRCPDELLWYHGTVIRLNEEDYKAMLAQYPGNDPQFMDWLSNRDKWLSEKPERKSNWYMATSNALKTLSKQEENA